MAVTARRRALAEAGLLHPAADAVTAEVFATHPEFFAAFDKVQVKYEMLRAHVLEGRTAAASAAEHGYSRASFYLVAAAFERGGMVGLLDERPGRRGPLKLSPEVLAFLSGRSPSRRRRTTSGCARWCWRASRSTACSPRGDFSAAGCRG
jgi:hypothetical protein